MFVSSFMGRDISEDNALISDNEDGKSVEVVSPRGEKDGIVKKLKSHRENGIIGLLNNGGHRGNSFGALGGSSSHESESDEHGHRGKVNIKPKKKKKDKKKKQKIRKKKKKKYPSTISVVHDEYYAENEPSNEPYSDHQSNYWPDTNVNDHYNLVDLVDMLPDPPNTSKPKKMKIKKKMKGKPGKHKYGRDIGGSVGGLQYSITISLFTLI